MNDTLDSEVLEIVGPQLILVEDDDTQARLYANKLAITKTVLTDVTYVSDLDELRHHGSLYNARAVFWVDIDLGSGKKTRGLDIVAMIREKNPRAYILVLTANASKTECMKAGANEFFRKKPGKFTEIAEEMNSCIEHFLLQYKDIADALTTYYARVEHIDEENRLVKLLYHFQLEQVPGEVELASLSGIKDLSVLTSLRVQVYRHSTGHRINYESVPEIPGSKQPTNPEPWDNIDLDTSPIFTNKPKL